MSKKPPFTISHGSYPFDVLVSLGHSDEELFKWMERNLKRRLTVEERGALEMPGIGRTVMHEAGWTVLRIKPLKNKALHHANIAHEAMHAVEFLFDRIGLPHSVEGGEAWAYQLQHLIKQIYEKS